MRDQDVASGTAKLRCREIAVRVYTIEHGEARANNVHVEKVRLAKHVLCLYSFSGRRPTGAPQYRYEHSREDRVSSLYGDAVAHPDRLDRLPRATNSHRREIGRANV